MLRLLVLIASLTLGGARNGGSIFPTHGAASAWSWLRPRGRSLPQRRGNTAQRRTLLDDEDPLVFLSSSTRISKPEDDAPLDRDTIAKADNAARSVFWPPWPFSLLSAQNRHNNSPIDTDSEDGDRDRRSTLSTASLVWDFSKTKSRVAMRNFQEVGSQLWFHCPPASPPLIFLASLPRKQKLEGAAVEEIIYKRVVPLWSNAFVRNLALSGAGLAIMSWAHSELRRKRRLATLPLADRYRDINRAVLPPFLPEEVPIVFLKDVENEEETEETIGEDGEVVPPRLSRHWKQFAQKAPTPVTFRRRIQEWKRMRRVRHCERKNAHRMAIMDELVALQTLKKKARQQRQSRFGKKAPNTESAASQDNGDDEKSLGYALVTGASKGIGRAIAVELARWEIPLILVARDVDALTALAYDLTTCFGVDCCVLPADLSKPSAAENIYKTVQESGLNVDVSINLILPLILFYYTCGSYFISQILVNNAGVSSQGESLDLPLDNVRRMIQVNTVSVSLLTQLFGRDMKDQGRGRILMVSSVCGAVGGIANVAIYSATKAFENSFGLSIGKELEPYGVGVTLLMPGAVHGTEFKSRSHSQEAICWKIPFYSKSAPFVAECGVRALLRGETEVTPGLLNRVFLKVIKPVLPQRLHNLAAEIAWSPLKLPFGPAAETIKLSEYSPQRPQADRKRTYKFLTPQPLLLRLHEEEVDEPELTPAEIPIKSHETALSPPDELAFEEINSVDVTPQIETDITGNFLEEDSPSTTEQSEDEQPPSDFSSIDNDVSDIVESDDASTAIESTPSSLQDSRLLQDPASPDAAKKAQSAELDHPKIDTSTTENPYEQARPSSPPASHERDRSFEQSNSRKPAKYSRSSKHRNPHKPTRFSSPNNPREQERPTVPGV